MSAVQLMTGKQVTDDRGSVSFVNCMDFQDVRRYYVVKNHVAGFVRAWHAHRREGKYITVVTGAALVACVRVMDWHTPNTAEPVDRMVISAAEPQVLYIPPGYANGIKTLTPDAVVLVFSTATVEESKQDDVRFPPKTWNIWDVEER